MKNSISQKYSIFILIILILILVYIHIPNPPNVMRGGAELEAEIKNMINNDKIYSYTLGHPIIQWVILVLIIGLIVGAYFTSVGPFSWTGAPVLGITGSSQSFAQLGPGFLKKFYILTNDTFMNKTNGSPATYPDDMETYKNNLVDFKTSMKSQINIFCNAVLPCSKCQCPGYVGVECGPNPNKPGLTQGEVAAANAAKKVIEANSKSAEKFFGIIPKCCCLQKIQGNNTNAKWRYVADPKVAADKNHPCWIADTSRTNSSYSKDQDGQKPVTTYKWDNDTASCTALLAEHNAVPTASLNGCDTSGGVLTKVDPNDKTKVQSINIVSTPDELSNPKKPTDGTIAKTPACVCSDGDPTLNFYEQMNKPAYNSPSSQSNTNTTDLETLFITWGNIDIKEGVKLGTTEKSYRATKITPLTYKLPSCYYSSGTTLVTSAVDADGFLYNNIKDGSGNIILDTSTHIFTANLNTTFCNTTTSGSPPNLKCPADGKGSKVGSSDKEVKLLYDAFYMNGINKYIYVLPKSSFNIIGPDLTSPDDDFAKLVKSQLAEASASASASAAASASASASRAGSNTSTGSAIPPSVGTFFGGIYDSIFPPKN
jgi:hypothetical protein